MTKKFLIWLKKIISENRVSEFYQTYEWHKTSARVLSEQHECQICKSNHKYGAAEIAHHIYTVRKYPEYALSIYMPDGQPNIIAVCKKCHNDIHMSGHGYKNIERW